MAKSVNVRWGMGRELGQLHNHTNHNINNMIIMELLTLKKNKKQLAYRREDSNSSLVFANYVA